MMKKKKKKETTTKKQGRIVRKPVDANPGLLVNRIIYFSTIEMFLTDNILCSLKLLQLQTEG